MPDEIREVEDLYLGSEVVALKERAIRDDGTIPVKIIQPGWGSSGYYSPQLLEQYASKWKPGTQMYLDHPTESEGRERPERSVRDLAGVLTSPAEYRADGPDGPGLYAEAQVIDIYKPMIEALAPHIGVSIRAHGVFEPGEAEGRKGRIITRIDSVESVDFVTRPGAGGKVLALMESMRQSSGSESDYDVQTPTSTVEEADESKENDQMELTEAQARITELEGKLSEAETMVSEANDRANQATERADRAEMALAVLEAQREAGRALADIDLPAPSKQRISESVAKNPPIVDGQVDLDALKASVEEAAKAEAEYLAKILGTGEVKEQGKYTHDAKDDTKIQEAAVARFMRVFGMSEDQAKLAVKGR
jgi:uncharacterized coiled-coil protein SlyX